MTHGTPLGWNSKCRKPSSSPEKLKIRWAEGTSILRPGSAQPQRVSGPVSWVFLFWFFFYKRLALRSRLRGNSPDTVVEFWVMQQHASVLSTG